MLTDPAAADYRISYCDGAAYATNIYRTGDPESPGSELTIRIIAPMTSSSSTPKPNGSLILRVTTTATSAVKTSGLYGFRIIAIPAPSPEMAQWWIAVLSQCANLPPAIKSAL